jgi:acylphosphatase
MLLSRAHLIVKGRVQGVFFRASARRKAEELRLTGWVRNNPDGTVEAVVEGNIDMVEKFVNWCREGPPNARVAAVEVSRAEATGEFTHFIID